MKKLLNITLFFSIFIPLKLYSQPQLQWAQTYNSSGTQDDNFVDMKLDGHGNIYITGYTIVSSSNYDIVTMKYNSSGILEWVRTYDGLAHGFDSPVGIQISNDGFVYVAGTTKDSIATLKYLLIKYGSGGDSIWVGRYNNSLNPNDNYNEAEAFILDNSGNIFITGVGIGNAMNSNSGFVTIKVDSEGNKLWTRYYKSPAMAVDIPQAIKTDNAGNVYVSGGLASGTGILLKYNTNGDSIFGKFLGLYINSEKIYFDNQNNLCLGGPSFIAKCNPSGDVIWLKVFRNPFSSNDFIVDNENNFYVSGSVAVAATIWSRCVTVKFNSNGDSLWSRSYEAFANSHNVPASLATDKFQNIYVTGYAEKNPYSIRFLTLKYSTDSTFKWAIQYNNGAVFSDYEAKKILLDSLGNIYVVGSSQTSGLDITLVKYSQPTSINQISDQIPELYILSQNYPNPFNPFTKIEYSLPKSGLVSIRVYDRLGRMVKELIKEFKQVGNYSVNFDGSEFASGIYFYKIQTSDFVNTKRMVLVK